MSLLSCVDREIGRYGSSVTIDQGGDKISTKAFLEPLRYRNKIYIGGEYRTLGFLRREKYLYVGKSVHRLVENKSVIETQDNKYIVKRCETYFVRDTPVYEWAILVPYGEEREDDYDTDTPACGPADYQA